MYIVIQIKDGKHYGTAKLMPKQQYERIVKIMNNTQQLHIVDVGKIDQYPQELFEDKAVKRYVKKLQK